VSAQKVDSAIRVSRLKVADRTRIEADVAINQLETLDLLGQKARETVKMINPADLQPMQRVVFAGIYLDKVRDFRKTPAQNFSLTFNLQGVADSASKMVEMLRKQHELEARLRSMTTVCAPVNAEFVDLPRKSDDLLLTSNQEPSAPTDMIESGKQFQSVPQPAGAAGAAGAAGDAPPDTHQPGEGGAHAPRPLYLSPLPSGENKKGSSVETTGESEVGCA